MKITVEESGKNNGEVEVLIKCGRRNEKIEKLISAIQLNSQTIIGKSEGKTYFIPLEEILYIDTVDEKVFLYTNEKVYETDLRLYEIEVITGDTPVMRVNKSTILNLMKVDHVEPMLNGKIKAILFNRETIIISRLYVHSFKRKLGI